MKPTARRLILLIAAFMGMIEVANAFYDPGLQRWINRDPIGERGGVDIKANSGESSPEIQMLETSVGRIEEQHEREQDFNNATKQIGDLVGTETDSWVLVSAK